MGGVFVNDDAHLPFILKPVRDAAWSISDEVISGEHWADHIYQLL